MNLVFRCKDNPSAVSVAWMWFPYFIAFNNQLIEDVGRELDKEFLGRELDDGTLIEIEDFVIDYVSNRYNGIVGLDRWLRSLREMVEDGDE